MGGVIYPQKRKLKSPWGEVEAVKTADDKPWTIKMPWGEMRIEGNLTDLQIRFSEIIRDSEMS